MARGSTRKDRRRRRPSLEGLEGRQLLDGGSFSALAEVAQVADPQPVKRLAYQTPRGVAVAVNLVGPGTLAGSEVRPDGALDLVFDGTDQTSQIVAHTLGGPAPLATVRDADVPLDAQAGSGANLLGLAGLRPFNLIEGGVINLIGGVRKLLLNNVGRNTQVFLRELPEANEENAEAETRAVRTAFDNIGGVQLVSIDGIFSPITTFIPLAPTVPELPPPGVRIQVNQVQADPLPSDNPGGLKIGNPQVFGYDADLGRLIRFEVDFDEQTGQTSGLVRQVIDAPSLGSEFAGVSLGSNGTQLVALVGQDDTIRAFDARSGAFVGQFTTSNLTDPDTGAPLFDSIDALARTDVATVVIDSQPGPGVAQSLDLAASLDAGLAVPVGDPFVPDREFGFIGGATGVAGFELMTATGRGFFDPLQPNRLVLGGIELDTNGGGLAENDRFGAPGNPLVPDVPIQEALGSVDQFGARVVGVSDGQNLVNLINRDTLAVAATARFDHPNRLAGLSESFRPDLAGSSIFDVQGDIQAFLANRARGLVLNNLGTLNLLGVGVARDSFVAGFPVNHVSIGLRQNVQIVSPSPRPVGGRGGVDVISNLPPIGPLFIP